MHIRNKFTEYKREVQRTYELDSEKKLLDISTKSMDELVHEGYVIRKIDSFLYYNSFDEAEINVFFNDECREINTSYLGAAETGFESETVYDLICSVKYDSVRCKLWYEMVDFLMRLKEESINKN